MSSKNVLHTLRYLFLAERLIGLFPFAIVNGNTLKATDRARLTSMIAPVLFTSAILSVSHDLFLASASFSASFPSLVMKGSFFLIITFYISMVLISNFSTKIVEQFYSRILKFDQHFEREFNVQINNSDLSRYVAILSGFSFFFFLIVIPLHVVVSIEGKRLNLTWRDLVQIITCIINFIGQIGCILIVQYRAKNLRCYAQKYFRNAKQRTAKDTLKIENALLFLGNMHSELCEAIKDINGIYQGRLFVSCVTNYYRLANQLFNLLRNLQQNASLNTQFKIDSIILSTVILNVGFITLIAIVCQETELEVHEASKMISNLESNINERDAVNMINQFNLKNCHRSDVTFNVYSIFDMDLYFIFTMFSAVATYLLIMIQIQASIIA